MRGIVLAGGSGSRLYPLTRITNKHLLPVYDRPMVYFAIEALVSAGIDRILVVTGGNHAGEFLPLLGNGSQFGLKHLDYTFQERPGGIAEALGLAEHFAGSQPVCVMLADNIYETSIASAVRRFGTQGDGARVLLARVSEPQHYGVPVMEGDRIVRIDEKPASPASAYAVTGCYMYDNGVFEIVRTLVPSGRGELEITDVNNAYVRRGKLCHEVIDGFWADCGESFGSYLRAANLVASNGANRPAADR
ncbi:MAG: NTP transferase domain-containing protein [Elusimicrobia bacterium]|nr:NTP transferase domain-containing protein [Elusimicrobiota bacterium]